MTEHERTPQPDNKKTGTQSEQTNADQNFQTRFGLPLTPASVITLQRTYGNHFVSRFLQSPVKIQRSSPFANWKTDSAVLFKPRSKELQAVDDEIEAYEPLHDSRDFTARLVTLIKLETAIKEWKKSKTDETKSIRYDAIQGLESALRSEMGNVSRLRSEASNKAQIDNSTARDKTIPLFVTDEIKAITDLNARADAVFNAFMLHFRGKTTYTLVNSGHANIFSAEGAGVACGTIALGLAEAFQYAGLQAESMPIASTNFITVPIGDTFIDTNAVGNVTRDDRKFVPEKRFFFSEHYITKVNDSLYYDPTAGIKTDAGDSAIIDPQYSGFQKGENDSYKKDAMTLSYLGNITQSGGGYRLKE